MSSSRNVYVSLVTVMRGVLPGGGVLALHDDALDDEAVGGLGQQDLAGGRAGPRRRRWSAGPPRSPDVDCLRRCASRASVVPIVSRLPGHAGARRAPVKTARYARRGGAARNLQQVPTGTKGRGRVARSAPSRGTRRAGASGRGRERDGDRRGDLRVALDEREVRAHRAAVGELRDAAEDDHGVLAGPWIPAADASVVARLTAAATSS